MIQVDKSQAKSLDALAPNYEEKRWISESAFTEPNEANRYEISTRLNMNLRKCESDMYTVQEFTKLGGNAGR